MSDSFGGIDITPAEIRQPADAFVEPTAAITKTDIGKYVVPHWVCGNYLQIWSPNSDAVNAKTFEAFLNVIPKGKLAKKTCRHYCFSTIYPIAERLK